MNGTAVPDLMMSK